MRASPPKEMFSGTPRTASADTQNTRTLQMTNNPAFRGLKGHAAACAKRFAQCDLALPLARTVYGVLSGWPELGARGTESREHDLGKRRADAAMGRRNRKVCDLWKGALCGGDGESGRRPMVREALEEIKPHYENSKEYEDVLINARLYIDDAENFLKEGKKEYAVLSIGYADGLVDALRIAKGFEPKI
mgnify:CR=1 FL=1